jgi:hypothetical protein
MHSEYLFVLHVAMMLIIIFLRRAQRTHAWSLYMSKTGIIYATIDYKYCPLIFICRVRYHADFEMK